MYLRRQLKKQAPTYTSFKRIPGESGLTLATETSGRVDAHGISAARAVCSIAFVDIWIYSNMGGVWRYYRHTSLKYQIGLWKVKPGSQLLHWCTHRHNQLEYHREYTTSRLHKCNTRLDHLICSMHEAHISRRHMELRKKFHVNSSSNNKYTILWG